MQTRPDLEDTARAVSAHYALRIYAQYAEDRARSVMRGMVAGVLMSAASVLGWDETRKLVGELDASAHLPPPGSKPHLVVVNGNAVSA